MSLFKPKHILSAVDGEDRRFFPMSLTVMWRRKEDLQAIRNAVAGLFADTRAMAFNGQIVEERTLADGTTEKITQMLPFDPAVIEKREADQRKRWNEALDALFSESLRTSMAELFMDSLRDEYARHLVQNPAEQQRFLDSLDLGSLADMVRGFVAANAKVFGPLGQQVAEAIRKRLESHLISEPLTPPDSSSEQATQ